MNRFDARAGVTLLLALVTFTRIGGVRAEDPTPGEVDAGADAPTGALDAPADRALDAPAPDEAAAPVDGKPVPDDPVAAPPVTDAPVPGVTGPTAAEDGTPPRTGSGVADAPEPVLLELLGPSPPAALRLEAIAALGDRDGAAVRAALLALLGDHDPAVRLAIIDDLSRRVARGDDAITLALRRGVALSVDAAAAQAAVAALAALVRGAPATAAADLTAALGNPRVEVRAAALLALARLDGRRLEQAPAVRAALHRTLAAAPLRTPGRTDERGLALAALAAWGDPATCLLPVLEAIERDPGCHEPGLAALRAIVGRDVGDLLAWWRLWGRAALLWPEHEALLAALDGGAPASVTVALERLAHLPHPRTFEAIDRLVSRLEAADAWTTAWGDAQAVAACHTLGALADRRGAAALQRVADAPAASEAARSAAQSGLARVERLPLRRASPAADGLAAWQAALSAPPRVAAPPPVVGPTAGGAAAAREARAAAAQPHPDASSGPPVLPLLGSLLGALVFVTGLVLAVRRGFGPAPAQAVEDAAQAIAVALRELEAAPVASIRAASPRERRRFTEPPDFLDDIRQSAEAQEERDEVVHVVLSTGTHRRPGPAAPPAPAVEEVAAGGVDDAVPADDPAWRQLQSVLIEMGPGVAAVSGRDADSAQARALWTRSAPGEGLEDALTALAQARPTLRQVSVRLVGSSSDLVLFDADARVQEASSLAAPPAAGWPGDDGEAGLAGALAALRAMGGSVATLAARLSVDGPDAAPRVLFPAPEAASLDQALAALEELAPLVIDVRARLEGAASDLVLLDRSAAAPTDDVGAAPPDHAAPGPAGGSTVRAGGWSELLEAIDELGPRLARVVVRGADGGEVTLFADDEGGLPALRQGLAGLEDLACQVRARLVDVATDLVLLDLDLDRPAGRPEPARGPSWRELLAEVPAAAPAALAA